MNEYKKILSNCALIYNIKEEDYNALLTCIKSYIKNFKPNENILIEGDTVNYVGVLLEGSLEILKENYIGNRYILDFISPSDIFGEGIVCTSSRISPVTVRAKESSKVLFIPYEKIIKTCENSCVFHVQLIRNMMLLLGEKNLMMNNKIEILILKGMREKIATFLLKESKKAGSKTFNIIPNRNQLAEYLNVSRTSMCRELSKMKDEGIIDFYQNSFKIISMEKLTSDSC